MTLAEKHVLEKEIAEREKAVVDLTKERREVYLRVKDFGQADAVTTDKAIERMKRIDVLIKSQNKEIRTRKARLKLSNRE
jgi:hypothetical protein